MKADSLSSDPSDMEGKKKKRDSGIIWMLALICVPLSMGLLYNLFQDQYANIEFYSIAIEMGDREVFESEFKTQYSGAVNKDGEFLLAYSASNLAYIVGLYLDPWTVADAENDYFTGRIELVNTDAYYMSEYIGLPGSKFFTKEIFFGRNGYPAWIF
ncbi:MAG: hypothetical protein LBB49_04340, partial [Gracilibacteraceae bacterium]|nr:hypothetical protein [Gracilibacteraceae bacterium]